MATNLSRLTNEVAEVVDACAESTVNAFVYGSYGIMAVEGLKVSANGLKISYAGLGVELFIEEAGSILNKL